MPPHRSYHQSTELSIKQPCKHCEKLYLPRGIKQHERSCLKEILDRREREKHNRAYLRSLRRTRIAEEAAAVASLSLHPVAESSGSPSAVMPALPRRPSVGPSQSIPVPMAGHSANSTRRDVSNDYPPDFKTESHPRSKRSPLHQASEELGLQNTEDIAPDSEPWRPFASEGDYIFATIAVEAGLSAAQVDSLLSLIHRVAQGTARVTLCNSAALHAALSRAGSQLTPSTSDS
ncbi:hypothetical protein EDD16DRAFT_173680 [Pisolithus croceorrhizus]|nr:hypothetical protein EDD16DRAFT_173680 [Pisolithus croceorrhizus]KAI6132974.1 hypothetical protein EV401DRAFT_165657 [Pisolithus croceorrhizus]